MNVYDLPPRRPGVNTCHPCPPPPMPPHCGPHHGPCHDPFHDPCCEPPHHHCHPPYQIINHYNKVCFKNYDEAVSKLKVKNLLPGEMAFAYYFDKTADYGINAIAAVGSIKLCGTNIIYDNADKVQQLMDKLQDTVSANNEKFDSIKTKLDMLDDISTKLDNIIKNDSSNSSTINGSLDSIKENIENLKNADTSIFERLDTIDGSINTLETSVAALETQSSKYLTSINEATTTALGGIKIGYVDSGKNVAVKLENQKAYVTITDSAIKKALGFIPAAQNEHGEAYTLTVASDVKLGGIKTGYTSTGVNANKELPVTLNSDGCAYVTLTEKAISSAYSYTLPTASISKLGGICTGFTNIDSKVKVDMSDNNAYVKITKDAINSALGYTPLDQIPKATEDTLGLLKVGYTFNKNNSILNIPVKLDEEGNAYISINLEDLNCYSYKQ